VDRIVRTDEEIGARFGEPVGEDSISSRPPASRPGRCTSCTWRASGYASRLRGDRALRVTAPPPDTRSDSKAPRPRRSRRLFRCVAACGNSTRMPGINAGVRLDPPRGHLMHESAAGSSRRRLDSRIPGGVVCRDSHAGPHDRLSYPSAAAARGGSSTTARRSGSVSLARGPRFPATRAWVSAQARLSTRISRHCRSARASGASPNCMISRRAA